MTLRPEPFLESDNDVSTLLPNPSSISTDWFHSRTRLSTEVEGDVCQDYRTEMDSTQDRDPFSQVTYSNSWSTFDDDGMTGFVSPISLQIERFGRELQYVVKTSSSVEL